MGWVEELKRIARSGAREAGGGCAQKTKQSYVFIPMLIAGITDN
jgi:hypothetical protein